jgi:hypothetical protein
MKKGIILACMYNIKVNILYYLFKNNINKNYFVEI